MVHASRGPVRFERQLSKQHGCTQMNVKEHLTQDITGWINPDTDFAELSCENVTKVDGRINHSWQALPAPRLRMRTACNKHLLLGKISATWENE